MTAVPCAECRWLVSPAAAQCNRCGAPMWVADPPKPPEPPPPASYRGLIAGSFAVLTTVSAAIAFVNADRGRAAMRIDRTWPDVSIVPDTRDLVGERIHLSACRHDWRACADNRDWARNGDWTGPQGACLTLAEGASRLGHFGWDGWRNGPRFDGYVNGTSIRDGYIVLADHGAMVRDVSGGWIGVTLHCTFDFVAWRVHSLAPV